MNLLNHWVHLNVVLLSGALLWHYAGPHYEQKPMRLGPVIGLLIGSALALLTLPPETSVILAR